MKLRTEAARFESMRKQRQYATHGAGEWYLAIKLLATGRARRRFRKYRPIVKYRINGMV